MRAATALVNQFREAGFVLARSRKHLVWRCPCGHATLTSPATPGKGRSIENARGDIARTIRICRHQMRECA